jgi:hypothetical protein
MMKHRIAMSLAALAATTFLYGMTPCEEQATAIPDDSWTAKEWKEHKAAVKRWKEKKGVERYNPKDPKTEAYRVEGDEASFKQHEALELARKDQGALSETEKLAYQVPDTSWSDEQWEAYHNARKSLGLE